MQANKIREDRENIEHRRVTKKQSIATIKCATSFNMEAASLNFQAPGCILYSDGVIPLPTRKSATNGHPPNSVSFHGRHNKRSAVSSTGWCNIFYFNLSHLLLCLRTLTNLCLRHFLIMTPVWGARVRLEGGWSILMCLDRSDLFIYLFFVAAMFF